MNANFYFSGIAIDEVEETIHTASRKILTRSAKRKATEITRTSGQSSIEVVPTNKRKRNEKSSTSKRTRIIDDDNDEDQINDDTESITIFSAMTESILPQIKRKIAEIKRSENVDTAVNECIICLEGKPTMVLLPCRHQITCERCWFIWAEGPSKPKCPKCKKVVKQTLNVIA